MLPRRRLDDEKTCCKSVGLLCLAAEMEQFDKFMRAEQTQGAQARGEKSTGAQDIRSPSHAKEEARERLGNVTQIFKERNTNVSDSFR